MSKNGPIAPMALKYANNGQGRDSYIYSNNGGFTTYHKGSVFEKPGTMRQVHHVPSRYRLSPTKSKPYHYTQDGRGRDTYILDNHGGFLSP
jgi:hypothetical protein